MTRAYRFETEGPTTDVLSTPDALRSLLPEWDALCARDREAGLFLSPRWLAPILTAQPDRWLLITARDATGRLLGLLPLARSRSRVRPADPGTGRDVLGAAGRLAGDEDCGFVCDPAAENAVLSAFGQAVQKLTWTDFALPCVSQTGRLERFASTFDGKRFRISWPALVSRRGADAHVSPRLHLPRDHQTFLDDTLTPRMRDALTDARREHLEDGALRIEDTAKADFCDRVLDHALSVWQGRWKAGSDRMTRLRAVFDLARAQGLLTMPTLFDGPRMVAVLINFADARTGYELAKFAAGDPERDDLPVGLLLHAHAIEAAITRGRLLYDFGRGSAPYKSGFGATDTVSRSLMVER